MKILFVDDDLCVLRAYERLLRKHFTLCMASSPCEALAAISNETFAVIVSDMRMPEMNGVEFLAKAKEISSASIQILLTGNPAQLNDAETERYFRCLQKPCSRELLLATLEAALASYITLAANQDECPTSATSALE